MKHGYYADNELPQADNPDYKTNSQGYRCPEFRPLPDGGKNVVVLGCSHTFGEGLEQSEIWISQVEKLLNNKQLRFWNLAQPGASADKCVRILYGCEKVLFPKIVIVCWPAISRRERLDHYPLSLTGDNPLLKTENDYTDRHNLFKCVFQMEKFAEYNRATVFHCFADEVYPLAKVNVLNETSLKTCWPEWDRHHLPDAKRKLTKEPNLAKDGIHYGIEHHRTFAQKFYNKFKSKVK
jgi:hypothetical protein